MFLALKTPRLLLARQQACSTAILSPISPSHNEFMVLLYKYTPLIWYPYLVQVAEFFIGDDDWIVHRGRFFDLLQSRFFIQRNKIDRIVTRGANTTKNGIRYNPTELEKPLGFESACLKRQVSVVLSWDFRFANSPSNYLPDPRFQQGGDGDVRQG